jgi:hypothetical protein
VKRALPAFAGLLLVALAHAHPLGNNTVNRQAAIHVSQTAVGVRYLVDLAEIPTLLGAAEADTNGDGTTSADEWQGYARRYGAQIREGLDTRIDGDHLTMILEGTQWELVPGAAGLDTLRIEARLSATLAPRALMEVEYRDHRHPDEQGWKEVFFSAASGTRIDAADVPQASLSRDLTAYPAADGDRPNVLTASAQIVAVPFDLPVAASRHVEATGSRGQAPRGKETLATETSAGPKAAAVVHERPRTASVAVNGPTPPVEHTAPQALAFFRLGVHHIATGWDHLLFLFGLVVAQVSLRRLAWVITAFTAAHSLTLGLAAGGLVTPPGDWVEPAIALTIAYLGLSNLLGYSRHNASLALAFGLVHGFGFAGALAETMGNIRIGGDWLLNLAAFNLGIEAFQLALILALLPLQSMTARFTWSATARNAASLAVMGAGIGWFFSRI